MYVQLKIQENVSELRAVVFVGLLFCFVNVLVIRSTICYLCFSGQFSCCFSGQLVSVFQVN